MRRLALVPAAGGGRRMGRDKMTLALAGRPLLWHTLTAILAWGGCERVIVAAPPALAASLAPALPAHAPITWVPGGAERQDSVASGLAAMPSEFAGTVLVHDGARPLCTPDLLARVTEVAEGLAAGWAGAAAALPVRDTLHRGDDEGAVAGTLARAGLWAAQTPQAFAAPVLRRAHATGLRATDDAALVTGCGGRVRLVPGEATNLKVTYPEDLAVAEAVLARRTGGVTPRVGHGWDVHRLVPGRPLVLGGVRLAHPEGPLAHSDGDVLCHAVMDACLGAAGLGDIGTHFPDSDPAFAGADSLELMARVAALLSGSGWRVGNVDATVVAEAPRLSPHVPAMRAAVAGALRVPPSCVGIKATTAEGLGPLGEGRGIAAHAVALLQPLSAAAGL